MPAAIDASIVGGGTIHAERTTVDYHDKAGDQHFKAPQGPECCSYNGCGGPTIPYFAGPRTARPEPPGSGRHNLVDHGGHHIVAIWPPDADVGLIPRAIDAGAGAAGPPDFTVEQLVRGGETTLISGRRTADLGCASCAALLHRRGDGRWTPVGDGAPGTDAFIVMVTTDLDRDNQPEALVRVRLRNGYALMFLGNDWGKPHHEFGCGGI